jgi:hypothetical protein
MSGKRPAHQNKFKFYHNPNSKKTIQILAIQHRGLCNRCEQQIEWRKTYRKYKPLKEPNRCAACEQTNVMRAYHILCDSCSRGRGVCAKCLTECDSAKQARTVTEADILQLFKVSSAPERFKRSMQRNWERGMVHNRDVAMLLQEAEQGNLLDWREYKIDEEDGDDVDDDDDDAADMGASSSSAAASKKKSTAARGTAGGAAAAPRPVANRVMIGGAKGRINMDIDDEMLGLTPAAPKPRPAAAAARAIAKPAAKPAVAAAAADEDSDEDAAAAAPAPAPRRKLLSSNVFESADARYGALAGKSLGGAANMQRKLASLSKEAAAHKVEY